VLAHGGPRPLVRRRRPDGAGPRQRLVRPGRAPPKRLPDYYAGFDLAALARKWIFGTDWPGVPGVAHNVRAVAALGLPGDTLAGHAAHIYPGLPEAVP
jgi:hypothetical protein